MINHIHFIMCTQLSLVSNLFSLSISSQSCKNVNTSTILVLSPMSNFGRTRQEWNHDNNNALFFNYT
jgi:hypothetical protein